MYIQPNTNIHILKGIPLNNNYNHTIYFEDKVKQYQYFYGKKKHTLIENTYQRINKGVCRVGIQAELLYDCNYMMFQNQTFGTKWFYAFINKVEYVNNNVSEIYFEIDVMQTWFFDYTLNKCFVEREHSVTDGIGECLVPENLSVGEYLISEQREIIEGFDDKSIVVAVCDTGGSFITNNDIEVNVINGTVSGATYYVYSINQIGQLKNLLQAYREKPEAIVSMYMIPTQCIAEEIISGGKITSDTFKGRWHNVLIGGVTSDTQLDGYTPKNNKLYTYPYNYYEVNNCNGEKINLRYEFFKDNIPQFEVCTTLMQPVEVTLRPRNYRGLKDGKVSTTECITLTNFPTCTWSNDSFTTWLGKNAINIGTNLLQGIASAMIGMSTGSVSASTASVNKAQKIQSVHQNNQKLSTIENASSGILNTLSSAGNAYIASDVFNGNQSNNANWANGMQQFYGCRKHITKDMAKSIDNYFSMFGYQTNKVKTPNISSRPTWNYVKTNGCTIKGNMPIDDNRMICSVFDSGITFWKHGDWVGDYSLSNSASYIT